MAYRRRVPVGVGVTRSATFSFNNQEISQKHRGAGDDDDDDDDDEEEEEEEDDDRGLKKKSNPEKASLGGRATRASAAHRHSSAYASAYASPAAPATAHPSPSPSFPFSKESSTSSNDSKYGFWGILARKAKSILEEDNQTQSSPELYPPPPSLQGDNARLRKGIDAITSSLNHLGDTLGNAFEEGRTIMEHKTADIIQETRNKTADFIQETRKLQLRRRGGTSDTPDQATVVHNTSWQRPVQISALANQETQLKASRDVAMATAAKAKVLLRELKTVKADLAFAKERCAQLEEENKRLRESREKGDNPADDDLIRLQLETLLAEKARLAHENSIYARENRFLREIVEYHQLTMQDVVYLDEGTEEVTEVYPFSIDDARMLSSTPKSSMSPDFLPEVSTLDLPPEIKEHTRETPKDVFSNTSSLLFPSSPPMIDPISCPPGRTESSEAPISAQLQSVAEEMNASWYSDPPSGTSKRP